jgi:type I restriction enzyme S subunit
MKHNWQYKSLGEVAEIYNGNSINTEYKRSHFLGAKDGLPFIATKDVSFDGKIDYDNGVRIPNYHDYKIAYPQSVFICAEGGSAGKKVAYIEKKVCFGNKLFCIKPNEKVIKGVFLYQYIQGEEFKEQFKTLMTGLIGGVSSKKIKTIDIPIPPLSEQEEIVSQLDKAFEQIETLRHNAEQSLSTAQQLFQSTLTNLLTPQPHWQRKTLGEISEDMYRGAGIKRDEITNNGTPCLRYGEIYTTYNYSFDRCISHTDINKIKSQKYFEHGDLLFAITGESVEDIGKTVAYIGHEKCLLGGDIVCMKHNQNPEYLAYALSTADAIRQKGKGKVKLKVVHTSIPALKEIEIPIPPLPEQATIVAKLDSLSAKVKQLKDNYTRTVALCDEMKQALLKEVFE